MKRTQVYLPEELYNELKLLAATGEEKFSDLVREGVKEVIKKRKKKTKKFDAWKKFIGAGKGGEPKDLSSKIDYYLYVEPYKDKKKKK